jgi:hypothetical protein
VNLQACANSAWTLVAYSFTASSSAGNGIEIDFDFGNNFGSSSDYICVTELDIRVTPGATAGATNANPPPVELLPIAAMLGWCERYYYRRSSNGTSDVIAMLQAFSSSGAFGKLFDLPATMRAAPTINISSFAHLSAWNAGGSATNAFSSGASNWLSTVSSVSSNGMSGSSGLAAGDATMLIFNTTSGWVDASAEL